MRGIVGDQSSARFVNLVFAEPDERPIDDSKTPASCRDADRGIALKSRPRHGTQEFAARGSGSSLCIDDAWNLGWSPE
jgi:hypothetical protein